MLTHRDHMITYLEQKKNWPTVITWLRIWNNFFWNHLRRDLCDWRDWCKWGDWRIALWYAVVFPDPCSSGLFCKWSSFEYLGWLHSHRIQIRPLNSHSRLRMGFLLRITVAVPPWLTLLHILYIYWLGRKRLKVLRTCAFSPPLGSSSTAGTGKAVDAIRSCRNNLFRMERISIF